MPDAEFDTIAIAQDIAPSIKKQARMVDEQNAFPVESLALLRQTGLMGMTVPEEYGGHGISIEVAARVAQILAGACLSTAMIWSMHIQQVACLINYAEESLKQRLLPHIATGDVYVASIVSERERGGHLLSAFSPLRYEDGEVLIVRETPTCTGGLYGDGYLLTMRRDTESSPADVIFIYASRSQVEVDAQSTWNALGMRGTQSVGLSIRGRVPCDQMLQAAGGATQIVQATIVPVGHIIWASSWLGAIKEAFRDMQNVLRDPKKRQSYPLQSDLFLEKWARIRLEIDTVEAYLEKVIRDYAHNSTPEASSLIYRSPAHSIQINNLKILASEQLFQTINHLIQLAGLRMGYLKNDDLPLERIMRDLRSASLMYANSHLLLANGKLALIDRI